MAGCSQLEVIQPTGKIDSSIDSQKDSLDSDTKDDSAPRPILKVVSVSDNIVTEIEDFEKLTHAEVQVDVIDINGFTQLLLGELQNEGESPDVILLESADLQNPQLTPYLLDLTELDATMGLKNSQNIDVYTKGLDKDDHLIGVTYQMNPIGFFYRRSLAREVLGTDDPNSIQGILSDYSRINRVANTFAARDIKFLPNIYAFRYFQNINHTSWLDDSGMYKVDTGKIEFLNSLKQLKADQAVGFATEWSDDWLKGMYTGLTDEQNNEFRVFGYVLPSWGLQNVLMLVGPENAEDKLANQELNVSNEEIKVFNPTIGDWAVVPVNQAGFFGGEYLSIVKGSDQLELAKQFVQYMVADTTHLKVWSQQSHQLFADNTINDLQPFTEETLFLGGQDFEDAFREIAQKNTKITNQNITDSTIKYIEKTIEAMFEALTMEFIQGDFHTVDEAMSIFEGRVREAFPELFAAEP